MLEQIADLLAQGYKAVQVASMCGCSEAYISELLKENEQFKERLREKMKEHIATRLATKYDQLEENTLKQLNIQVNNELDVDDLTRILEAVARIKNANKATQLPAGHYNNPTVGLTLIFPQQLQPKVITDDGNRVVSIGDRTMVPMPARAVKGMFEKLIEAEKVLNNHESITLEELASEKASGAAS